MKLPILTSLAALVLSAPLSAQDTAAPQAPTGASATAAPAEAGGMPAPAEPSEQHRWLERFVGRWESESTCSAIPDQPMQGTGEEVVRSLGGLWVVAEGKGEMGPMAMNYLMTVGYDPAKQKYVATWVDSVTGVLWIYEGTVDEATDTLTLETEGICPMTGQMTRMRDTTVFVDADHRTFRSEILGPDGEWTTLVTGLASRKGEE